MIITIADAVFAAVESASDRRAHPQLLSLLLLGDEGRHRILIDPLYESNADRHVNRWLSRRDQETREAIELALDFGIKAAAGFAFEVEFRVDDVPMPDWRAKSPILPLAEALELARRPLVVLVEDRQSDGMFLRLMAPADYAPSLDAALRNEWIKIDNGGGLGNMTKRIKERDAMPGEHLRIWVMFDSDRRAPDSPSADSNKLKNQCVAQDVAHHQLRRRAIENYLPREALDHYTKRDGSMRRDTFDAFFAMEPSQRHCYNLKTGFKGDRGDGEKRSLPEHFGPHREHPALQAGFGPNIWGAASKYLPPSPSESWLKEDGSLAEAQDILRSLLQRL